MFEAVEHGSVEGRHLGGVQEVENIPDCRSKPLDTTLVQGENLSGQTFGACGRKAVFQETAESDLVRLVLVNVWNAQFWLPVKRMSSSLKHLFLLGYAGQNKLRRRSFEVVAEAPSLDALDDIDDTPANGAKSLHALLVLDEP